MPFSPVHKARKLSAVLGTTVAVVSHARIAKGENHVVPSLNCDAQMLDAIDTRYMEDAGNLPAQMPPG
jgi:hypothetical protein